MNGFTTYKEYCDLVTLLPSREEQGELILAIWEYMFYDIYPENLNDAQKKIFVNLKRPLDKSKTKGKNGSITNQKSIENKSKANQNKIENKSKINQTKIKTKSHQDVNVSSYDNNYVVNVNGNVNDSINDNNLNIFHEDIFNYVEKNYKRSLSPVEINKIIEWQKDFTADDSEESINESLKIIKYAVDLSVFQGAKTFSYVEGILKNWKGENFKTYQQIKDAEAERLGRFNSRNRKVVEVFDYDWLNDPERKS